MKDPMQNWLAMILFIILLYGSIVLLTIGITRIKDERDKHASHSVCHRCKCRIRHHDDNTDSAQTAESVEDYFPDGERADQGGARFYGDQESLVDSQ
jgi:hypothetical protein